MRKIIVLLLVVPLAIFAKTGPQDSSSWGAGSQNPKYEQADKTVLSDAGISGRLFYSFPSGDIASVFYPGLGVELTPVYRNFLMKNLDVALAGSIITFSGQVDSSNTLQMINIRFLGRYNFKINGVPGIIYADAGGGIALESLTAFGIVSSNADPLYQIGFGYELMIMKDFNLNAEINYALVPEQYMSGASRDGSFLNFGLGISYNLSISKPKTDE